MAIRLLLRFNFTSLPSSLFVYFLVAIIMLSLQENSVVGMMDPSTTQPMKVAVVGGTHGNEYTGVWCIKSLNRRLSSSSSNPFSKLKISTLLGNPEAHLQNKRFIDQDLNRQFSYKALIEAPDSSCLESKRAQEINAMLGPKSFEDDDQEEPNINCIIDLHTTTTNMGITLIVGEGDSLMTKAAAYIIYKCNNENGDKACILMHTHKNQKSRPHLSSIASHALSIEFCDMTLLTKPKRLSRLLLNFLKNINQIQRHWKVRFRTISQMEKFLVIDQLQRNERERCLPKYLGPVMSLTPIFHPGWSTKAFKMKTLKKFILVIHSLLIWTVMLSRMMVPMDLRYC